ncbi:MAG: hypothetical protein ACTMHL_01145 [Janibacter sp.]
MDCGKQWNSAFVWTLWGDWVLLSHRILYFVLLPTRTVDGQLVEVMVTEPGAAERGDAGFAASASALPTEGADDAGVNALTAMHRAAALPTRAGLNLRAGDVR